MGFDRAMFMRAMGEFTGTAMLLFLGCAGVASDIFVDRSWLEINYNFSMAVMTAIQCFIHVSGCHINPNVSMTNCILGYMKVSEMAIYWLMQVLGAILGYAMLMIFFPARITESGTGFCCTIPLNGVSNVQVILVEFLLTFVLALYCCAVWDEKSGGKFDSVPVRFGFLIIALTLSGASYTCTSVNWARTLGPAIFQTQFDYLWLYLIGQILGTVAAPLMWKYVFNAKEGGGGEVPAE